MKGSSAMSTNRKDFVNNIQLHHNKLITSPQADEDTKPATNHDQLSTDTLQKTCASESYFHQLKEHIFNQSLWDSNRFHVFNHEAGTGKTRWTLAYIAELVMTTDARVVFVQKFAKDADDDVGALKKTVAEINSHSHKEVAGFINSKMHKKSFKEIDEILKLPVLVITHKMYQQICRGLHSNYMKDRDVLIIDEFPHLVERVSISRKDIGDIWINADMFEQSNKILSMADDLRLFLLSLKEDSFYKTTIPTIRFDDEKFNGYQTLLKRCLQMKVSNRPLQTSLESLLHILKHGCIYYQSGFHTFNHDIEFKLLKNNIILDANAEFEKRYELSPLFHVVPQNKYYDYANSTLYSFNENTSKSALSKKNQFFQTVLDRLDLADDEKTLFVTDKERKGEYESQLVGEFSEEPVQVNQQLLSGFAEVKSYASVDYFGNLIGVNAYKDYQHAIILKTPYFDFPSYVLDYLFYREEEIKDAELFSANDFDDVRNAIVAGEIYQALKRVNRNNALSSKFIVFMNNKEVMQLLLSQFPNIQFVEDEIHVRRVKKHRVNTNKEKAKAILMQMKNEGKAKVRKKELRDKLEIASPGNFKKILNELEREGFFKANKINCPDRGQVIYFAGELLQQSS